MPAPITQTSAWASAVSGGKEGMATSASQAEEVFPMWGRMVMVLRGGHWAAAQGHVEAVDVALRGAAAAAVELVAGQDLRLDGSRVAGGLDLRGEGGQLGGGRQPAEVVLEPADHEPVGDPLAAAVEEQLGLGRRGGKGNGKNGCGNDGQETSHGITLLGARHGDH